MLQAFSGAPGVFDDLETVPKGNLLLKVFFVRYHSNAFSSPIDLGTYNMDYEWKLEAVLRTANLFGSMRKGWDEYTVRWSAVDQNNVSSPISREIYFAVKTKSDDHTSGKSSF